MTRLLLKIFLFLLPIIIFNQILIWQGYLFSTKNDYLLIRNLKANAPAKLTVKVFGSSRVENGISPEALEQGFKKNGIEAAVFNCGMNGRISGWGLQMFEKYSSPCDLAIIEIMPDKSLTDQGRNLVAKLPPATMIDQLFVYHLNHFMVIHQLPNLLSDIRGRLPIRYMKAHRDGWTEACYYKEEKRLKPIREKIHLWAERDLLSKEFLNGFGEFVSTVKHLQKRTGCKIIFLRMPVNGKTKLLNDQMLAESLLADKIKHSFPDAVYIDATTTEGLDKFVTVEESHLDSKNAVSFSYELGLNELVSKK